MSKNSHPFSTKKTDPTNAEPILFLNGLLGSLGKVNLVLFLGLVAFLVILNWDFLTTNVKELKEVANTKETKVESIVIGEHKGDLPPLETQPKANSEPEVFKDAGLRMPVKNLPTLSSIKVASWNLYNIGISKDDEEIAFISKMLKNYDIVAVQEISTKLSGPRAIVKLADELNRRGSNWDYVISDPTSGEGSERYAYLWKTSKVLLDGRAWLVKGRSLAARLDREPYMARFAVGENSILIANFHAVPTSKKPIEEIKLLDEVHNLYTKDNLVILGDFNLSQKSKGFDDLRKKGYNSVLKNQKTSLRRIKTKSGSYLAREYDNIFYKKAALTSKRGGVINFVKHFKSLKAARKISDHLPVWAEIAWR